MVIHFFIQPAAGYEEAHHPNVGKNRIHFWSTCPNFDLDLIGCEILMLKYVYLTFTVGCVGFQVSGFLQGRLIVQVAFCSSSDGC